MLTLTLIFLIIALVCFAVAAINIAVNRVNLIAAGLFFTTCAVLLQHIPK